MLISKAVRPTEKLASPVAPRGDLQRIARKMPSQPELGESLWQGRNKKGRRKGELATFPCRTHAKC